MSNAPENTSPFLPNKPKFVTKPGRNCCRSATAHELAGQEQDCETDVHNFDDEGDKEPELDDIWEANVMNQQDPKIGRYVGNKSGNKSSGFKKGQNQKCQAKEMQGTRS